MPNLLVCEATIETSWTRSLEHQQVRGQWITRSPCKDIYSPSPQKARPMIDTREGSPAEAPKTQLPPGQRYHPRPGHASWLHGWLFAHPVRRDKGAAPIHVRIGPRQERQVGNPL